MNEATITVVLLSRNRPEYTVQTIQSILNQSENRFRFVVSDNSSNKKLFEIMTGRFPTIEYVSWYPGLHIIDHFKKVISLVDTRYFVMFHDDDLMEPNFIKRILEGFRDLPSAAAIATNGWEIDENGKKIDNRQFFKSQDKTTVITSGPKLLRQYLSFDFGGVCPFGSYAYNYELIKGLFPDFSRTRNYWDTLFLMEVIQRGPIVWIHEALVRVRIHQNRVSTGCGVLDYKPWIKLSQKYLGSDIKKRHIDEYRFLRLFFSLKNKKGRKMPTPVLKYFISALPKLIIFSHSFRKRIFRKIFNSVK